MKLDGYHNLGIHSEGQKDTPDVGVGRLLIRLDKIDSAVKPSVHPLRASGRFDSKPRQTEDQKIKFQIPPHPPLLKGGK